MARIAMRPGARLTRTVLRPGVRNPKGMLPFPGFPLCGKTIPLRSQAPRVSTPRASTRCRFRASSRPAGSTAKNALDKWPLPVARRVAELRRVTPPARRADNRRPGLPGQFWSRVRNGMPAAL